MLRKYLILGAFIPLVSLGETLPEINVVDNTKVKQNYKEENFYKTYSTELITKEDIKESSATSIEEVLGEVSGIVVKDQGSFSKSLSIRGLSGERVVSVVDGVKMSNHGMTMGGGGELSLVNASSVEKIEVIKGSPSIVYDPGATGGVIKVTTIKNPRDLPDKVQANYTFNYDDGYMLQKHTANVEAKYKDIFFSLGGSIADSKGRRVKDQEKQDSILHDLDEEFGTKYAIDNFGYKSESLDGMLSYQFHDKASVYYKQYFSDSSDITQAYGTPTPVVFHYVDYDRSGNTLGLNLRNILGFNKIELINSNQKLYKTTRAAADSLDEVTLDTNVKKISTEYVAGDFLILSGYEHTEDDADTLTLSNQIYDALYLSTEYIQDAFTITGGARYNKYHVTQELKPGQNPDTAPDLVGVSGVLKEPINDDAINYSAGALYSLNEQNNISLNFSRTYRYPSLYERFAFGSGFIGGGAEMQAEEANNYELSYKHLSDEWSVVATIFQSDFDTYNSFRTHKTLKTEYQNNLVGLLECESNDECELFDSIFLYETFKDVQNRGFELDVQKKFLSQKITTNFNASLSETSDAIYDEGISGKPLVVVFDQNPLEFRFDIKKEFKNSYKPWIKLKLRYVTDIPEVKQEDKNGEKDFHSFGVADLHFGAKTEMFTFNGGIRNLTDKVYHEAYSPLDGVERTVFFNVGIKLEKLL